MAMTKYGYAVIIGNVVPTEGTILGFVGGKMLGFSTKKWIKYILLVNVTNQILAIYHTQSIQIGTVLFVGS
jgi:hypothetical protein